MLLNYNDVSCIVKISGQRKWTALKKLSPISSSSFLDKRSNLSAAAANKKVTQLFHNENAHVPNIRDRDSSFDVLNVSSLFAAANCYQMRVATSCVFNEKLL